MIDSTIDFLATHPPAWTVFIVLALPLGAFSALLLIIDAYLSYEDKPKKHRRVRTKPTFQPTVSARVNRLYYSVRAEQARKACVAP